MILPVSAIRNYHAEWVVPVTHPPIEMGTVSVEGSRIVYVGPRHDAPLGEEYDLGNVILIPGLINAHTHLELTGLRGFLEGLPFVEWIRMLTRARLEVVREDAMLLDAARWGILEGLSAGVTTYADTCWSGVVMQAMREMGVRGIMYQEIFGPAPEQREASMAGLRAAIARLRPLENSLVRLGVSPHAVYTVHEDLLIDACAYAIAERLPVAIHLAESAEEMQFLREGEGPFADGLRARGITVNRRSHSPVHLLVELGVMVAHPLLIHCVQVDEVDVSFIAEHQCAVAHCPVSNAKLGHGIAPVRAMRDAGITVALGSDSMASNNHMNLLSEARTAALMQNAREKNATALSADDVLRMATIDGARALGMAHRVGSLEVGKEADFAAFPLYGETSTPMFDPVNSLIFALSSECQAQWVMVAGEMRVREGQAGDDDSPDVGYRVQKTADLLSAWRARLMPG